MAQLSKFYRNDSTDGLDPKIARYLDEAYLHGLKNFDKPNPKVVVVFSGGNAVGKSTLAKRIGDELNGVVIENDGIKRAVLQVMPDIDKFKELNPMVWQYTMDLYRRLPKLTKNGLIVRDGLIDWYFDRILPVFIKAGYRIFIVQFEVGKQKAAELITARGDTEITTAERLLTLIDDQAIHQARFRNSHRADIVLTEHNLYDHDAVIATLREVITSLPTQDS